MNNCGECGRAFTIFWWRNKCTGFTKWKTIGYEKLKCSKIVCSKCVGFNSYHQTLCRNCGEGYSILLKQEEAALQEKRRLAKAVESFPSTYKGRLPIKPGAAEAKVKGEICDDREDALFSLKMKAVEKGMTLLYDVSYKKHTSSEPSNNGQGHGTYISTSWSCNGMATERQ